MSLNAPTQVTASTTSSLTHRDDIDGLRAVAILLVVIYHVWVGRVSGGVDAFLMISAFFLTGSFVRRIEQDKPLGIVNQWVRTFKRLLPPAAFVLLGTLFAGLYFLPESRLIDFFRSIWASLFYVENWKLAGQATDYYADKIDASPVQHFWSLSVQGQVFLLWPLLFLVVLLFVRRTRFRARAVSAVVLAAVFVASFAYSVQTTFDNQEAAYFDTWARLWEFSAGALLFVALPWIRVPRWARSLLGLLGIIALVSCGMVIDVQGGFPGYLALWPVLSVAAIIISGTGERPVLVGKALSWRPLVALGRDAYGLYLVHWPILIFTIVAKGGADLSFFEGLLIVLCSILVARSITWLIDDRIRYASWANASILRGFLVIILSMLVVAGPTLYVHWSTHKKIEDTKALIADLDPATANPGAASLVPGWTSEIPDYAPTIPLASDRESDWGGMPDSCDGLFAVPFADFDAGCNALSATDPALTVVVVGDSHTQQWLPPVAEVGVQSNWQMYSFVKGACPLNLRDPLSYDDQDFGYSCSAWMEQFFSLVLEIQPDVVVTVGTHTAPSDETMDANAGQAESLTEGQDAAVTLLHEYGIPVVLLRDNPRFTFNAFECAETSQGDPKANPQRPEGANSSCGVARDRALAAYNPADSMIRPGVATVDMTDFICDGGNCAATIGNVFVYLDDNHLTATYARTMAPMLAPRLTSAIGQAMSWE